MSRAITVLSGGSRYRWRLWWGRRDGLSDVLDALDAGRSVAMLVGRVIPRHWVLLVGVAGEMLECYEPSSGELRVVDLDAVRLGRLTNVGYPRPFAFVLPRFSTRSATA